MAAIAAIDKLAGRMCHYLRRAVVAGEPLRQRAQGLQFGRGGGGVVIKRRKSRFHFVNDIGELAAWVGRQSAAAHCPERPRRQVDCAG